MRVAMYCVHGHEVSQAVRGFLAEMDIEAVIVEGGFEAWKAAGLPVAPLESADV
jgi:thiosulfate sulfurtransferase